MAHNGANSISNPPRRGGRFVLGITAAALAVGAFSPARAAAPIPIDECNGGVLLCEIEVPCVEWNAAGQCVSWGTASYHYKKKDDQ
jgi:hypothetical protein